MVSDDGPSDLPPSSQIDGQPVVRVWLRQSRQSLLRLLFSIDEPVPGNGAVLLLTLGWADAGPEGRQALASALFAKTEVEGYRKMTYEFTPDAVELGLHAALPEVFRLDFGEFGRGERGSASLTHLRIRPRFVLENRTPEPRVWPVDERKAG